VAQTRNVNRTAQEEGEMKTELTDAARCPVSHCGRELVLGSADYERYKGLQEEILQRQRESLERPLLTQIDSLRLENRSLTTQKAEFFAEFERLRERAEKAEELLAACRMSRQQEVDSLRNRISSLRGAALKLPRPWMDGSIEFDEWIAAVDKVIEGMS